MNILVFEAASSGLMRDIYPEILSEGLSMLTAFVNDLYRAGYKVSTIINREILDYSPKILASRIYKFDEFSVNILFKLSKNYDLTYIIAPESDGLLSKILGNIDNSYLNCSVEGINLVSNKAKMYFKLHQVGVKIPETIYPASYKDIYFETPLIIKKVYSVGCEGLKLITSSASLKETMLHLKSEDYIVQRFISGIPASISMIVHGGEVYVLSLNRQFIRFIKPGYYGGYLPLKHRLMERAIHEAVRAVKAFDGLKGYVGVDLIFSKDDIYIIDINPRLTVSYIGVYLGADKSPADYMIRLIMDNEVIDEVNVNKYVYFRKTLVRGGKQELIKICRKYGEMFTPPVLVRNLNYTYSFIATTSNNSIYEANIKYLNIINKIKAENNIYIHP